MVRDSESGHSAPRESARKRGRSSKVSREKILEAALVEFAEKGYEGATTAAVARRVSVTQPLIHYHFGSKEALWRAAVALAFTRMGAVLQGVEEDMQRVSPREGMAILTRRFVYFNARHPEVARLILSESGANTPRLQWMTDNHVRPLFSSIEAILEDGKTRGTIKDLPAASILFAFLGAVPHFFDSAPLIRTLYGFDPLSSEKVELHATTLVEIFASGLLTDLAFEEDRD